MSNYTDLFSGGGAGSALGSWAVPVLSSKSFTMTRDAKVQIAVVAATGSGSAGFDGAGSGANSSPWGVKVFSVAVGDVISFEMGACGAPAVGARGAGSPGNAGNSTLVKLNGVTLMTAQPGEPGVKGTTPTAATATVIGADRVVPGLRSLTPTGSSSGGSAVDIFNTGRGRGGTDSAGAVGVNLGVAPLPLRSAEFGMAFLGQAVAGMAGVGGSSSSGVGGAFAGGFPTIGTGAGCKGGYGAGGSSGAQDPTATSGAGGDAYAYMIVAPKG